MTFEDVLRRAEALAREVKDETAREELVHCLRRLAGFYAYVISEGQPEPHPMEMEPPTDSLEALVHRWREEGNTLRMAGADALATVYERHADQLEATDGARRFDAVTLEEAAEIGGYSYEHLQRLVSDGRLPNAGRKGSPRIYRQDIPRKPGHGSETPNRPKLELVEEAVREGREAADG